MKIKDKINSIKLKKANLESREQDALEKELKDLKRSPFMKKVRKLSKKKMTKEEMKRHGKGAANVAKSAWNVMGKLVNKLDKIKL